MRAANSCGVCEQCLTGRPAYCTDFFARNFANRTEIATRTVPGGRHARDRDDA